ncbi:MAG: hypothetical protein JWM31_2332 [Solirubrobacterales bacterium]|nr:hypothetical protein [Solirubrobacterales bacterium]
MRHLAPAVLAGLALTAALAPAATGAATRTLKCAAVETPTGTSGPVSVTHTTCTKGRLVARTYANTGRVSGWTCVVRAYDAGANISCRKRGHQARVRFQVAD